MEIKVPKEVRQYHESIFFGLSLRQFGCSLAAVGAAVGMYFGCVDTLGTEATGWVCILGAAPLALAGFFYLQRDAAGKIFVGGIQKPGAARPAPRVPGEKPIGIYSFVKKGGWKNQPPFSNTSGKKEKTKDETEMETV